MTVLQPLNRLIGLGGGGKAEYRDQLEYLNTGYESGSSCLITGAGGSAKTGEPNFVLVTFRRGTRGGLREPTPTIDGMFATNDKPGSFFFFFFPSVSLSGRKGGEEKDGKKEGENDIWWGANFHHY